MENSIVSHIAYPKVSLEMLVCVLVYLYVCVRSQQRITVNTEVSRLNSHAQATALQLLPLTACTRDGNIQ